MRNLPALTLRLQGSLESLSRGTLCAPLLRRMTKADPVPLMIWVLETKLLLDMALRYLKSQQHPSGVFKKQGRVSSALKQDEQVIL